MRSHPSCWNKTLAQLGFRRKRRKPSKAQDIHKRRSLFEMLEQRQMLSGDPLLDLSSDEIIVAATTTEQPIQLIANKPVFVLIQPEIPEEELLSLPEHEHDEVEPVFVVETVETKDGPKAIISLNPNNAVGPPAALQRLTLELHQNDQVVQSYDILIDIAEDDFREEFLADRIDKIKVQSEARSLGEVKQPINRTATAEEIAQATEYWNTFIGPKTLEQEQSMSLLFDATPQVQVGKAEVSTEDLVSIAKGRGRNDQLFRQTRDNKEFYSEVEKQTEKLKQDRQAATTDAERESVAEQEKSLKKLALVLAKDLRQDLKSTDNKLAQSARKIRDELVAISDPEDLLFVGLGVDNEVERKTNSQGDEKAISFIETGRYVFDDSLEIDLGDHPAMVQVTKSNNLRTAQATSVSGSPAVEDGTIDEANPNTNGGTATLLHVDGTSGSQQESLIRFDFNEIGDFSDPTTIASAALQLTESAAGTGDAEIYIWNGLLGGPAGGVTDWDESNASWYHIDTSLDLESNLSKFTQLNNWTAGTTTEIDVTDQIQRALLYGDANGDGVFGAAGMDGDIEAFHLAVTNWDAYVAEYGPRANSASDLLNRTDGGLGDGTIDTDDIADFFRRHGYSQGDYNLDGTVQDSEDQGLDGLDWATWQANYGLDNARFTQGDGNFDGVVDNDDYDIWFNRKNEDIVVSEEPEIIVWVRPEDSTTDIEFAAQEHATLDGPTLVVTEQPDLALNKFSVDGSNLVVDYAVLGDTFTDVKVQLYKAGDPDTLLHETAVQSGSLGSHEVLIATSVLSSIVEGDAIYAKVVGTPSSGTQANLSNDQLDFEFSTASTQTVNSLDDAGMDTLLRETHTLRELLTANESLGWFNTLTFDESLFGAELAKITLGDHTGDGVADQLDIDQDITIAGPGPQSLVIDARDQTRAAYIYADSIVTLSGLGITNGYTISHGAGIYNRGELTLDRVAIKEGNSQSHGGGIYNFLGATLDINASTLDGNNANYGGGISAFLDIGPSLTIDKSTVSNNTSSSHSGGLSIVGTAGASPVDVSIVNSTFSGNDSGTVGGAIRLQTNTELTIVHSTITDNTATSHSGGIFGQVGTTTTIHNSILAANTIGGTSVWATDASGNLGGTTAEPSTGNVIGIGQSGHQMDGNINTVGTSSSPIDPGLAPLADIGGPTLTHVPLSTSVAIGAADAAHVQSTDQTGYAAVTGPNTTAGSVSGDFAVEVNTNADRDIQAGQRSLRQAVELADQRGEEQIVVAAQATGVVPLTQGPLFIGSNITLDGPGADNLTIEAREAAGAIIISHRFGPPDPVVRIANVNISGASDGGLLKISKTVILDNVHISGNPIGPGIVNSGNLTIQNSTISDNRNHDGPGGGIFANNGSTTKILNSTVSGNSAMYGGGIYTAWFDESGSQPDIDVINSTISSNDAINRGGGIYSRGADLELTNATITGNSGEGGGVYAKEYLKGEPIPVLEGELEANNTIITGNKNGDVLDDVQGNLDFTNSTHNILGVIGVGGITPGSGSNSENVDVTTVLVTNNLGVPTLGAFGGPTLTHSLLVNSPAANAGDDAIATTAGLTQDQRGFARDDGLGVDIGATEYHTSVWREAENYSSIGTEGILADDLHHLEAIGDPTASGGRLISIFPGSGKGGLAPDALDYTEYEFTVDQNHSFDIWARIRIPDSGTSTLKLNLQELPSGLPAETVWSDSTINSAEWEWVKILANESLNENDYKLTIEHETNSVQIDKLLVTSDLSFEPKSFGGDDPEYDNTKAIQLDATVRDFNASNWTPGASNSIHPHPDFERAGKVGITTGLASQTLVNGLPQIASRFGNGTPLKQMLAEESEFLIDQSIIYDPNGFNFWFTDNSPYSRSAEATLHLVQDSNGSELYNFVGSTAQGVVANTHEFYPVDGLLLADASTPLSDRELGLSDTDSIDGEYDGNDDNHNAYFTLELHAEFTYRDDLEESQFIELFKSDDDLWIYIDGKLWIDNGGIHVPQEARADLAAFAVQNGLSAGESYTFDLFHAQRNKFDAHLAFQTNIELQQPDPELHSLVEESRFVTEQEFDIPAGASTIDIGFSNLNFDSSGSNPSDVNDAFELAILDEQGRPAQIFDTDGTPLLDTISADNRRIAGGSDAVFNFSQGQTPLWATGVEFLDERGLRAIDPELVTTGFVRVNLDGLRSDRNYKVVMRLVNNDADQLTSVSHTLNPISVVDTTPLSLPNYLPVSAQDSPATSPNVTFATLRDVTNSFDFAYQQTTIDALENEPELNELRTRLALTKLPGQQVRNDLLIAVRPPSPQFRTDGVAGDPGYTELINFDGILPYEIAGLPAGTPFVRVTGLMDSMNGFYKNATLPDVELAFLHEKNERFDFELVVLGELNDPPSFTSDPYADPRGDAYPIEFQTGVGEPTIPMLEIVAARENEFRYRPDTFDLNGDYTEISIEPVNIPDPTPGNTTDAYAGMQAIDTNDDGRNDTVVWTPYATTDLGVHTVTLRVTDEHGAYTSANDQTVKIRVVPDDFNRPPFFESPPITVATFGEQYDYDSYALDPDNHTLAYTGSLGGRPVDYLISDLDDVTGISVGDDLTYLTFVNNSSAGDGIGTFSNVRLYERDWPAEPQRIRFDDDRFEDYGAGSSLNKLQVVADTSVVRIEGDAKVAYRLPTDYRVTENTVLAFTFSSEAQGESHGIGVETQISTVSNSNWLRVYGTDAAAGSTATLGDYDPAWSVNQSTNFSVDSVSGEVTWNNIPTEAINHWVHVDLYATETDSGQALRAHQPYELFVEANPANTPPIIITPSLPDYTIPFFDTAEIHDNFFTVYRKDENIGNDREDIIGALIGTGGGLDLVEFEVKGNYEETSGTNNFKSSIGVFADGNAKPTYGLPDYGLVLSTGDVREYGTFDSDPPDDGGPMGHAPTRNFNGERRFFDPPGNSELVLLDEIVNETNIRPDVVDATTFFGSTVIEVTFNVDDPSNTSLFFDVVFGSEEWQDFVGTTWVDAFGIFLNPFDTNDLGRLSVFEERFNPSHPDFIDPATVFIETSNQTAPVGYMPEDIPLNQIEVQSGIHPAYTIWDNIIPDDVIQQNDDGDGSTPGTLRQPGQEIGKFDLSGVIVEPIGIPLTSNHPQVIAPELLSESINISTDPNINGVLWPKVPNADGTAIVRADTPVYEVSISQKDGLVKGLNRLVFIIADSGDEQYDSTTFISNISTVSREPYAEEVDAIDDDGDALTFTLERDFAFEAATNSKYNYVGTAADLNGVTDMQSLFEWDPPEPTINRDMDPHLEDYYYVKVIVDDHRGGTDEQIYTFEVELKDSTANVTPVIESVGDLIDDTIPGTINLQVGREASIPTKASDGDGDRLSYWLQDPNNEIPANADLRVDADGNIRWTSPESVPASDADGRITGLILRATDPNGAFDEFTFDLQIDPFNQDSNSPPEITSTAPDNILEGEVYRYEAKARDIDYDPLTWSRAVGPDDLIVREDGLVIWNTDGIDPGDYPISLEVSDGFESTFEDYVLTVRERNVDPIIQEIPIQIVDLTLGETVDVQVVANDSNLGDLLTYEIIPISELPAGDNGPTIVSSLLDPNTTDNSNDGQIDWAPPIEAAENVYLFEVVVTDGNGGIDSEPLAVYVTESPTPNTAPEFLPLVLDADPIVLNEPWTLTVYATDAEDGDSTALDVPAEFVVDIDDIAKSLGLVYDQAAGELRWTPTDDATATVVITASDTGGLPRSLELTLPVNVRTNAGGNEPSRIISEPRTFSAVVGGTPWTYSAEAEDLDVGDVASIQVESVTDESGNDWSGNLTEGLLQGSGQRRERLITWTPTGEEVGLVTIVVSADDGQNSGPDPSHRDYTQTIPIAVRRNASPFILEARANQIIPVGTTEVTFPFKVIDYDQDDLRVELLSSGPGDASFTQGMVEITGPFPSSNDPASPTQFDLKLNNIPTDPDIAGSYPLKVRITDRFGNPVEHTIDFSIGRADPLDATLEARVAATVGEEYVAQVTRKDKTGVPVKYKLLDSSGNPITSIVATTPYPTGHLRPVGLTIDEDTGRISWTPGPEHLSGPYSDLYSFTVAMHEDGDFANRVAFNPARFSVVETFTNTPPTIESDPSDIPYSLTNPFEYTLIGDDLDNDPLTWVHVSGPGDLVGDVFTWRPTEDDLGQTKFVVIRVDDPTGPGESQTIQLQLDRTTTTGTTPAGPGNTPPKITSTPTKPGEGLQDYVYIVRGEDKDGHDFTLLPPAQTIPTNSQYTWEANQDGSYTFTWHDPPANALQTFDFGIVDEKGLRGQTQQITLSIGDTTDTGTNPRVDIPISIEVPPQAVALGSTYSHTLQWTDPDITAGLPIFGISAEYIVGGDPAVAADFVDFSDGDGFNPATGIFDWQPTSQSAVGVMLVTVTARERPTDLPARVTYTLEVFDPVENPNLRPILGDPTPLFTTPGAEFSYDVLGTDDGPFDFYLVDDAGQLVTSYDVFSITPAGTVTWSVPDGQTIPTIKTFDVELRDDADQRSANGPVTYTVTVQEDQAPTVSVIASPRRQEAGDSILFTILSEDDIGIASTQFTVTVGESGTPEPVTVEADNTALFTIPPGTPDDVPIVGTASVLDSALQPATSSAIATVRPANPNQPQVGITSQKRVVIEELFKLRGHIYDADDNLVYYSIRAIPTDGGEPIVLKVRDVNAPGTFENFEAETQLVGSRRYIKNVGDLDTSDDLYSLSPFALANGTYEIEVLAIDDAEDRDRDIALHGIQSDQKLGNFALSFTDMTVPVAGFPISVVRKYDSLDSETPSTSAQPGFGYGWSLELVKGKFSYLSAAAEGNDFNSFIFKNAGFDTQPMVAGSVVTINLPGGSEHEFVIQPVPTDNPSLVGLGFQPSPGQGSVLDFVPREVFTSAPEASLIPLEYPPEWWTLIPEDLRYSGFLGAAGVYDLEGRAEFQTTSRYPINPSTLKADFRLTTRNGTQYIFDSKTFELTKIVDPFYGNTLRFNDTRYTATNRDGETIGELIIEEDNGLITAVRNESGDSVAYRYDDQGLLRYVFDQRATALVGTIPGYDQISFDSTPRPTTSFFYGEDEYSEEMVDVPGRVLTSIRGIASAEESDRTLTIGWDADGRVHKIGDASDAKATFTYDVALQNFSNDLQGWSAESIADAYGVPTEIVRDETGNVRRQIKRLSDSGNGVWQVTTFEYDSADRQIGVSRTFQVAETSPASGDRYTALPLDANTTTFVADPDNLNFDYRYWNSIQKYDDTGNLTLQLDSAGNRTTYSDYNDRFGFAGTVEGPTGVTKTTDRRGLFNEQRIQTTARLNTKGPNSVNEIYLNGGRVESISQIDSEGNETFNQARLSYDETTLLLSSSIDASGHQTYFGYDRADNQILSFYHWDDPSIPSTDRDRTVVTHSIYDERRRVTGTEQYVFNTEEYPFSKEELDAIVSTGGYSPLWTTSTDNNLADQVVKSTDRFGTETYTFYDSRGNVVETRTETSDPDPMGTGSVWIVTRMGYDKNGRQVASSDPFVVRNQYNPHQEFFLDAESMNNGLDEVLDPATGLAWGANARFHINHTLYDDIGRVKETRRVEFSDNPLPLALIYDANGGDSVFSTDFSYAYNELTANYNIASSILSNSTTEYNEEGRVYLTETNSETPGVADNLRTYSGYDIAGRLTHSATAYDVDGNGTIDVNLIDGLLDFDNPGLETFVTQTSYDAAGRQDISIDANGIETKFEYDDLGNILSTTLDFGGDDEITTRTQYDYAGRRTHTTDALNQTTVYGYAPATGRLETVTLPAITDDSTESTLGSPVYQYQYDTYGNQTKITDPDLNETTFNYNHLRQRTERLLDDGLTETMQYNDDGQVIRSIDFEGRTVDYLYDEFGRVDKKHYYETTPSVAPGMGVDSSEGGATIDDIDEIVDYAYDALGRLVETVQDFDGDLFVDFDERITTNTYDEQGRLTRVTNDEGTVNYAYDDLGRMTNTWTGDFAVNSPSSTTQTDYTYDALGRLATVTAVRMADQAVSLADGQTTYKYDAVGNLQYVISPDHASFYEYDNLNQLEKLTQFRDEIGGNEQYDDTEELIATFAYSRRDDGKKSGSVETFYDTDGTTSVQINTFTWMYDEAGRLVQEQLVSTGTSALTDYTDTYGYDLTGNRKKFVHDSATAADSKTVTYEYDGNNRLLWEKTDEWQTGMTDSIDFTTVYEYDSPVASIGSRQTRKATFSGDNETGMGTPEAGTDTHFEYDARGRLDRHEVIGGDTIDYRYNDNGIRISRNSSAGEELFLVDENNHTGYAQVLEEHTAAPVSVQSYLLGHDVIAQRDASDTQLLHFLYDGHGSTRGLVDAMGQRLDGHIYGYDAYGVRLDDFDARTTLLYSGEWRDSAGFDYLRARPYDFANGRFLRMDDFEGNQDDPQSLHKYLYTHADPLNGIDPSGLFSVTELASVGGIQNILVTGTNYIGTLVRAYNFASRFLQLLDYAQIAIRFARALHLSTPQGAAAAVANELRELFGNDSVNEITQAFSEVANHIGPHWGKISRRIAERAPSIAAEISLAVAPQLPGYVAAEAAGNLQFVLFTPTGPGGGRRRGDRLINVSEDFAIAASPSGGRLFGFGVRPNRRAQGFDQWFRIDYWDQRLREPLNVHYHVFRETDAHPGPGRVIWQP